MKLEMRMLVRVEIEADTVAMALKRANEMTVFDMLDRGASCDSATLHDPRTGDLLAECG
jgi:hypothetical protein